MFLIVRTTPATGSTPMRQTITGVATEDSLEEYILRHGIENCEVYSAEKLKFNITWQAKAKRNTDVSSD